ncbi:MerR family transcriptional regulator [Alkalihalophilus pseudofirmus]|uniref:MerR family transcriptional regulator n=1 Tax=Alkalihalophilus pseudofirmus TaxID=79885 RepID=UPI00259B895A|nr:MerR family transcriptional regulator [Alkalihalophilus pseudofirmus]WEG18873.1 MerR family transcriptional regulator [Alkalihalophilus pseudofirmus]
MKIQKKYYRIGEISDIFGIPKQTLRYYDKIGKFSPEYTDEENGYRYYSLSQLQYLHALKVFKIMGVSSSDIDKYMSTDWDLEKLKENYEMQIKRINNDIRNLISMKKSLKGKIHHFNELRKNNINDITLVERDEKIIYTKDVQINSVEEQEIEYYKAFESLAEANQLIQVNPGFIVKKTSFVNDSTIASSLFLDIPNNIPNDYNTSIIPKGYFLSLYIEDSYSNSPIYYKKLKDYIEENEIEILSDVFEFCYTVLPSKENDLSSWELLVRINPLTLQLL